MRKLMCVVAVTLLSVTAFGNSGAATEKSATTTKSSSARNSPVVAVVRKVRDSVVSLKVIKRSGGTSRDVVGTGVVIDERGYIVTNRHVVNGGDKITIKFWDNSELNADLVMSDPAYDLAVVKVRSDKKLPFLPLGPTSDLEVGEDVVAIGSPYGFEKTVTTGQVSYLGRKITMPDGTDLVNLIQHSAPIDPGNSGGPLLNYDGELIGINVALHDKSRSIAFALNAEQVQQVLCKNLSSLKLSGLNHGLTCRVRVNEEENVRQKVVVLDVEEKTPAAEAGVKEGDQIVRVGDYAVTNRFDIERAFWEVPETLTVTVIRKGEEIKLKMSCRTASTRR